MRPIPCRQVCKRTSVYVSKLRGWGGAECIECFIEDQAFSPSYDLAPTPSADQPDQPIDQCFLKIYHCAQKSVQRTCVFLLLALTFKPTICKQEHDLLLGFIYIRLLHNSQKQIATVKPPGPQYSVLCCLLLTV
jgi:hypothetical protein